MHFISVLLPLFLLSLSFLCHTQAYKDVLGDFLSLYKAPEYKYVMLAYIFAHMYFDVFYIG